MAGPFGLPKTTPRTILLNGKEFATMKELIAGGAITPGHLVQISSAGKWVVHNTAKGRALKAFADAYTLTGKDIDTAYANNDWALAWIVKPGSEVNALVAAGAAAIAVGDQLESAGDGTLRKLTADNTTGPVFGGYPIAIALAAVDNSGGGSAVRLQVMVM